MKLNAWQRAGIILSIVWALGAGFHTHSADVASADNFAKWAYKVCTDSKSLNHDTDLSSCDQERKKNLDTWMKGDGGNVAITALAPIPLFWFTAFILLYVGRAQVVGFCAVIPWTTLNRRKKSFVVFCALGSCLAILFGVTVALNLYVDTQVPVALSLIKDVIKMPGDNVVIAEGTWIRSGISESSALGYPLQTSKIECIKQENHCIESMASVSSNPSVANSGNVLMTDLTIYEIQSWTPDSIIFRNDLQCATEIFTIDLNTQAVTGAGHPSNFDDPWCKLHPSEEKEWTYQLSNGFNVYWEERKKARPFVLRVIQTLFGN